MGVVTPFPPDGVTPGATNPSDPGSGATEGAEGLRNDLRASAGIVSALMAVFKSEGANGRYREPDPRDTTTLVVYPDADGCSSMRALSFGEIADALIDDGWRRLVEDDDTIELVARALFGDFDGVVDGMSWDEDSERSREGYRGRARAAVRALREETAWVPGDPVYADEISRRWCQACFIAWTGGPSQCPTCGRESVEGCASCGARDGCPGCITPPEEGS